MSYICTSQVNHLKTFIMDYTIPKDLLSKDNLKTIKGEAENWKTYIMFLAPHKQNSKGVNLCAKASEGCASACLFNSGNARFNKVIQGRINKTEYFLHDMASFMEQLNAEITIIKIKEKAKGNKDIAIRLNGTTDFPFENYKFDGKNIMEIHPDIQFYDYTKVAKRISKTLPKNYHLTFSKSEINDAEVEQVLKNGGNVAVVFEKTPETFMGYDVIDGDKNDLRFLDKDNVIVGLKYKRASVKGGKEINDEALKSGFVVTESQVRVRRKQFLFSSLEVA